MTRRDLPQQLMQAADSLTDLTRREIQVLLRRAALRLRNQLPVSGTVYLDEDVAAAVDAFAADENGLFTRNDAANAGLRDWLVGHGYLRVVELDEDSETDGRA